MSKAPSKPRWKGLEELNGDPEFLKSLEDEFSAPEAEASSLPIDRRSFLKAAGFAFTGAVLAGCSRAPMQYAVPYLVKPEEITPGRPVWYASLCGACSAGCGLLVKTMDGRPIKLEGNPEHPVSRGGLCAAGQASVLELYDSKRLRTPLMSGKKSSWEVLDKSVMEKLLTLKARGAPVRFLSSTLVSPMERNAVKEFLSDFSDAKLVEYDTPSTSAILDAHKKTHGVHIFPRYRFDRADVIVSFDADFLGTWVSPVEYTKAYRRGRNLEGASPKMSQHIHVESRMSLTGANADRRIVVAQEEIPSWILRLAASLSRKAGIPLSFPFPDTPFAQKTALEALSERLWKAKGHSLVLCGLNDVKVQKLVNFINQLLENYGKTLDLEKPSLQRRGDDQALVSLIQEMREGSVGALFIRGANPVYELPKDLAFASALKSVETVVSFSAQHDETASEAHYVCPEPHFLESWHDAESISGAFTLGQPVIRRMGQSRSMGESLAAWKGSPKDDYALLRTFWEKQVFPRQSSLKSFKAFWEQSVYRGYAAVTPKAPPLQSFNPNALEALPSAKPLSAKDFTLVLYDTVALRGNARHAHNPWLQELPDPVTKITWDNYLSLSPKAAKALHAEEGDVLRLRGSADDGRDVSLELPVQIQPGQHDRTVAVALGFGGKTTERFANVGPTWLDALPSLGDNGRVGKRASDFLRLREHALSYSGVRVHVEKTGEYRALAATQTHHTLSVPKKLAAPGEKPRPIIGETTLAEFLKNPSVGRPDEEKPKSLWKDDHRYHGAHWGMAVDLTACTGCSACVIACQSENNVPVVGKDEVRRRREMHWMRIDRYYSENEGGLDTVHQPMFCQQCDNAPCETVCPVLATVHSSEGLNQQIYNRCVGTRYCENNCPYKTRRFNWFEYAHDDLLQNLALNPDVTVRSRGVMEKCTFCVQRIQAGKAEAKRQGRSLRDGDVQSACQQSCPAGAIVFGDTNDPKSAVSRLMHSPRRYAVLGELDVRPSVGYLTLVRNRNKKGKTHV